MNKTKLLEDTEYIELCKIVKRRLEKHNQKFGSNKKNVLKVLFQTKKHLSIEEISLELESLSKSTIHRVLSSYESLGVVDGIVIDDIKRFELVYLKQPHYHLYCQDSHEITEFENLEIHELFLSVLEKMNFKPTSFNVIINGVSNNNSDKEKLSIEEGS